jgi:hypothetical protein
MVMQELRQIDVRPVMIAAVLIAFTSAGCASVESDSYRFEVVSQPVNTGSDAPVIVRLVNVADGHSVTNAQVFALRTVFGPSRKGNLTTKEQRVGLRAGMQGEFIYDAGDLHPPETVWLAMRVAGEGSLVRGRVDIGLTRDD